jgi:hypothetical protein
MMIIELTSITKLVGPVWLNVNHIISIRDRKGGGSILQLTDETWLDVEEPSPAILERIYQEEKACR